MDSGSSTMRREESVFWYVEGILLIDYLGKEKLIIGEYYASFLDRLKTKITDKRPKMAKKKGLLHQDNSPVHSNRVA